MLYLAIRGLRLKVDVASIIRALILLALLL
jgi:hypothetical protein